MAVREVKFGILGCAGIARKLTRAIALSPNSTVIAVGSRSEEKAAKFARENGLPESVKLYGSYDGVLEDPEVDAVYVPLPTSLHWKWVRIAAGKKKHVLLEKPVALNAQEFDEILEACESNGVQIMDGTMWMHHPRTAQMKDFLLDTARFGQLKSVHSVFTFPLPKQLLETDIRTKPDLDALGALGDQGWYCIGSILWAADYSLPKSVLAIRDAALLNPAGVIMACSASLHWENGNTATFHCSFFASLAMDLSVVGTAGSLHLHDFIIPFEESKASYSTSANAGFKDLGTGWDPCPSEHVVFTELPQEVVMVSEFARLVGNVKSGGCGPEKKWAVLSRKTQLVIDAVKSSVEKGYEAVEVVE
ncbi:hypothetical protein M569_11890 [Genlisea aurea]|uniref:Uncharacterized protein n=1 Tax=Genlisea aurea TaxID=192259 RepID=S8C7W1_9LAMI|nr:hypothetical protein M569_11890 [Genlisea aurea]